MNKGWIWVGPATVLAFVVILAVMYGMVGSENSIGRIISGVGVDMRLGTSPALRPVIWLSIKKRESVNNYD